jgi:hypothetical protein
LERALALGDFLPAGYVQVLVRRAYLAAADAARSLSAN